MRPRKLGTKCNKNEKEEIDNQNIRSFCRIEQVMLQSRCDMSRCIRSVSNTIYRLDPAKTRTYRPIYSWANRLSNVGQQEL